MTPTARRAARTATIAMAAIAIVVPARLFAAPSDGVLGRIEATLRPRCITPAATTVVSELAKTGALQRAVGDRFAVARVDAGSDHVDLTVQDLGDHREHGISLVLTGARGGTPDGAGTHFAYFLSDSPAARTADAARALLAVAGLLDRSIPDAAIVDCSGDAHTGPDGQESPSGDGPQEGERRYPLSIALASAALEVLILVGAIVFGLRAIPPAER